MFIGYSVAVILGYLLLFGFLPLVYFNFSISRHCWDNSYYFLIKVSSQVYLSFNTFPKVYPSVFVALSCCSYWVWVLSLTLIFIWYLIFINNELINSKCLFLSIFLWYILILLLFENPHSSKYFLKIYFAFFLDNYGIIMY